jgi:hypothetical protein
MISVLCKPRSQEWRPLQESTTDPRVGAYCNDDEDDDVDVARL